jgi:hypothetical protein
VRGWRGWRGLRRRSVVVASLSLLLLTGAIGALTLRSDVLGLSQPPADSPSAAIVRWSALATKHDRRARELVCRKNVGDRDIGWTIVVDPIETLHVTVIETQATWSYARVEVISWNHAPWNWARPAEWFSDDAEAMSAYDWYVELEFEDNRWKVCDVQLDQWE